jgi:hypothetical protein
MDAEPGRTDAAGLSVTWTGHVDPPPDAVDPDYYAHEFSGTFRRAPGGDVTEHHATPDGAEVHYEPGMLILTIPVPDGSRPSPDTPAAPRAASAPVR